tara:strand:+ start:59 stop:583 length:525 start_codon:yes stop_codon:yes gene_type:complete
MGVITPTLTLTSNANTHTPSDAAGPLSIALSLTATDSLTVDTVEAEIYTLAVAPTLIYDGSALSIGTETPSTAAANQKGAYLYMKNTGTAKAAYVAFVSSCVDNDAGPNGSDAPTAPATSGTTALNEATNVTLRTFTLRPLEFAFLPWDYAGDLYASCEHSDTTTLEIFRFDRG